MPNPKVNLLESLTSGNINALKVRELCRSEFFCVKELSKF